MATKLITAVFKGSNGLGGFLTGQTYKLELSRNNGRDFKAHRGMLQAEYHRDNSHDVKPSQPHVFEHDEDLHNLFDVDGEVNFSKISTEEMVEVEKHSALSKKEISERKLGIKKKVAVKKAKRPRISKKKSRTGNR